MSSRVRLGAEKDDGGARQLHCEDPWSSWSLVLQAVTDSFSHNASLDAVSLSVV